MYMYMSCGPFTLMKSGRSKGGFSIPLFPWRYFLLKHQWRGTGAVFRVDWGRGRGRSGGGGREGKGESRMVKYTRREREGGKEGGREGGEKGGREGGKG